ncbi:hypothetical protein VYU27_000644 [Nannochloropsis oceanica]
MGKGSLMGKRKRGTSEILRQTRRHQTYLAFFLFTTLGFILFAALSRSGWALGRIISTSILMPEKVPCPPKMTELGPDAKCEASELVIFTSRINYGLFGDLKYETTSEVSIDTRAKTPGGMTRTWLEKKNTLVSSDIQPSFEHWANNFPEYYDYVRSTQAFVVVSVLATVTSLIFLSLITIARPAPIWARTDTLTTGFYALLLSTICLALSIFAWMGVPLSAFTTECGPSSALPSLNGTGISSRSSTLFDISSSSSSNSSNVDASLCIQLDGRLCLQNCSVNNTVIRGGGMYGLVVFSCLLQCVCLMFWAEFQEEVLRGYDQTPSRRSSAATPPVIETGPILPTMIVS